jgi:hypothetical protein
MAELIPLDTAAKQVGKSEVTIRRLVKAGKISAQKVKTLTGFVYRVDPQEVRAYYGKRGPSAAPNQPTERSAPAAAPPNQPEAASQPSAPYQAEEPQPSVPPIKEEVRHAVTSNGKVRVAVSDAEGDPLSYWLRRAETYEERYHKELERSSTLREELGLWRGRAENAQALLMKLLPAPNTVEVTSTRQAANQPSAAAPPTTKMRKLTFAGVVVVITLPLLVAVGAALLYIALVSTP